MAFAQDYRSSTIVELADGDTPDDGALLSGVTMSTGVKVAGLGWKYAERNDAIAGTYSSKGVRRIKMSLSNLNGITGSVRYRVLVDGKGWTSARDGASCGSSSRDVRAIKVWLTGAVSNYYDVYYRVHIRGYKWLDWTKNSKIAGSTKLEVKVNAIQVKLVKRDGKFKGKTTTPSFNDRWKALEFKYRSNKNVKQILEVKYTGGSNARVVLRKKKGSTWRTALSCVGYVGRQGIGSANMYLARTPTGTFKITAAFGILDNPGSKLRYVKVTPDLYWCGDRAFYNQLVSIYEHPHDCAGEHLIDYRPHYDYGLFFDYNTNPVRYGKGSAFFVHCTGGQKNTGGCVAVGRKNMVKIIRNVSKGARLCIYSK